MAGFLARSSAIRNLAVVAIQQSFLFSPTYQTLSYSGLDDKSAGAIPACLVVSGPFCVSGQMNRTGGATNEARYHFLAMAGRNIARLLNSALTRLDRILKGISLFYVV